MIAASWRWKALTGFAPITSGTVRTGDYDVSSVNTHRLRTLRSEPDQQDQETRGPGEAERQLNAFRVPRARVALGVVIGIALFFWSANGAQFNFLKLGEGAANMGDFVTRLFPPDFSKFPLIVELLIETLQMAVVGTALGTVLSLFAAFGAASNIAPRWLYYLCRWTMNIIRSLPDLVIALMFVSAVGLGPFAGILAMTVGSIESIGKIFAEAMESVDRGPITALEAVEPRNDRSSSTRSCRKRYPCSPATPCCCSKETSVVPPSARAALRSDFSPAPMLGLLNHLSTTYADPLVPLRLGGLADPLIDQLRHKVLI